MLLQAKQPTNELNAGLHLVKVRAIEYALSMDKTSVLKTSSGKPGIKVTFGDRNKLYFSQIFWIGAGNITFDYLFGCLLPRPTSKESALGVKLWIAIRDEVDGHGISTKAIFKCFPCFDEADVPQVNESEFKYIKTR